MSTENPRASVVVAVYNAEPWIDRCVACLLGQTERDLEFVFVDDASTDDSPALLERYASRDERIRILHNETNEGPGAARNRGIAAARGDYLAFMDCDDRVDGDFYRLLLELARTSDADIAKGRFAKCGPDGAAIDAYDLNPVIADDTARRVPIRNTFTYQYQSAIYARRLFLEGVGFGGTRNGEDTTFLLKVCTQARSIAIDDRAVYHYTVRDCSISKEYSLERSLRDLDSLEERVRFMLDDGFTGYDYLNVKESVRYYDGVFLTAMERRTAQLEDLRTYARRLRQIVEMLPDPHRLVEMQPELALLLEHDVLVPASPRDPCYVKVALGQLKGCGVESVCAIARSTLGKVFGHMAARLSKRDDAKTESTQGTPDADGENRRET